MSRTDYDQLFIPFQKKKIQKEIYFSTHQTSLHLNFYMIQLNLMPATHFIHVGSGALKA